MFSSAILNGLFGAIVGGYIAHRHMKKLEKQGKGPYAKAKKARESK